MGDQIHLILWRWKRGFGSVHFLYSGILEKKAGHSVWPQAPLLKMENSNLAPGPIGPESCLLWLLPGSLCSAPGNYFWAWVSCLNLDLSLFTPCCAEFQWAQMSESLWKIIVGERRGQRVLDWLAVAIWLGTDWSKLRWETGRTVRGLLQLIKQGPGQRL